MILWLPPELAQERSRAEVDAAIDAMSRIVEAARLALVDVATLDGARRHTAAALLFRALEVFGAARKADLTVDTRPVLELACRSIFEVTIRGRYLLACDPSNDEFIRMCHHYEKRQRKLAADTGNVAGGLPPFLSQAIAGTTARPPRDLFALCTALDKTEQRETADQYSAQRGYNVLYQWLSNSASHAGLAALTRLTYQKNGVLHMNANPPPLTTAWPVPVTAAYVGELAQVVFDAFGLPSSELVATGVALPTRPR